MIDLEAMRNHAIELRKMIIHCDLASVRTRRESDFYWERKKYLSTIHNFLLEALEGETL